MDESGDLVLVGVNDFGQNFLRVLVAGLDAFQIDHAQASQAAHLHAEPNVRHAVHRAGDNGDFQNDGAAILARDLKTRIHLVGVDGHIARHQGNLIKAIRDPRFPVPADPHSHTVLWF